jgi:hypothetical protein
MDTAGCAAFVTRICCRIGVPADHNDLVMLRFPPRWPQPCSSWLSPAALARYRLLPRRPRNQRPATASWRARLPTRPNTSTRSHGLTRSSFRRNRCLFPSRGTLPWLSSSLIRRDDRPALRSADFSIRTTATAYASACSAHVLPRRAEATVVYSASCGLASSSEAAAAELTVATARRDVQGSHRSSCASSATAKRAVARFQACRLQLNGIALCCHTLAGAI